MKHMKEAEKKKDWIEMSKNMVKHKINNAFTKEGLPMSDQKYGIHKMFPPELLHTTYEGITIHD